MVLSLANVIFPARGEAATAAMNDTLKNYCAINGQRADREPETKEN